MATKNRVVIRSNFSAVKRAAKDAMGDAIQKATDEMEAEAEKRLERANDARGWNLPTEIEQQTSADDGSIRYPNWWGRFFEYGTVHLPASPFMRPAHRKGKKRLVSELGDNFEGWIRRKAGMRRR